MKEFGEGVDRMYRELEVNGAAPLSFNTDDFILKVSVPRVIENKEKVIENGDRVIENEEKVIENGDRVIENEEKVIEKVIEKLIEKDRENDNWLTENRIAILRLIIENPYISKTELSESVGISVNSISRNIEQMRGKYIRRVGPDKGGFGEIIK